MKNFKLYFEDYTLLTEAKTPGHIDHLEELILLRGQEGYDEARTALTNLLSHLQGKSKKKIGTSVKWDGAPAIIAGKNPKNGKFFVGTKSVFNVPGGRKGPLINYTEADITRNHGDAPGLAKKLKLALNLLPQLGIKDVLWGDYMFAPGGKKSKGRIEDEDIDGIPHYTFKPNEIKYAVEVDSELGKKITEKRNGIGIVFHTQYHGKKNDFPREGNWGPMNAGIVNKFADVPDLWVDDARFTDDTGVVTLTEDEAKQVKDIIKTADSLKVNYNELPDEELKIYLNKEVQSREFIRDPENSYRKFIDWYSERERKKWQNATEATQIKRNEALDVTLADFESNKDDFINMFKVSSLLAQAKQIFINKYNNAVYNTKHFFDDGDGVLKVTNPEGYVAVSDDGNAVKLVNRLDFSASNFQSGKPKS